MGGSASWRECGPHHQGPQNPPEPTATPSLGPEAPAPSGPLPLLPHSPITAWSSGNPRDPGAEGTVPLRAQTSLQPGASLTPSVQAGLVGPLHPHGGKRGTERQPPRAGHFPTWVLVIKRQHRLRGRAVGGLAAAPRLMEAEPGRAPRGKAGFARGSGPSGPSPVPGTEQNGFGLRKNPLGPARTGSRSLSGKVPGSPSSRGRAGVRLPPLPPLPSALPGKVLPRGLRSI